VLGATGFSYCLRGRLFGVSNLDPAAYLMALAAFVATTGIAALVPAQRALRIDPVRALRDE
jgi:ABC-type antimicrobial peptide transport system permease subunit